MKVMKNTNVKTKNFKNSLKKIGAITLVIMSIAGLGAYASTGDYGSSGAADETTYTLESMLQYAIEDEYFAYAEYEAIINDLDAARPFTNIIKAEETHIDALLALYEAYELTVPSVDPSGQIAVPSTVAEALEAGAVAEIENIAMYDTFLSQDLPDDVRIVFEALQRASESHLNAFENSTGLGQGAGNGNMGGKGNGNSGNSNAGRGNGNSKNGQNSGSPTADRLNLNQTDDCILFN